MVRCEIVGDIALAEIRDGTRREAIARTIMMEHGRVKIVGEKKRRFGDFRTREIELIFGNRTTTMHREAGWKILLDVATCYSSEREKGERKRISDLVGEGENVLIPFAGVGAFPLLLAKRHEVSIKAIGLNSKAFKYLARNIRLNRLEKKIEVVFGDAYNIGFDEAFDRIILPQPYRHNAFHKFAPFCRKNGYMHYYTWLGKGDSLPSYTGFEILTTRRVSSYAPWVYKWCFDLRRIE